MASGSYARRSAPRPQQDDIRTAVPPRATRGRTIAGGTGNHTSDTETLDFKKQSSTRLTAQKPRPKGTRTASEPAPIEMGLPGAETAAQTKRLTRNLGEIGLDTGISTTQTTAINTLTVTEPTAEVTVSPPVTEIIAPRHVDPEGAIHADTIVLPETAIFKRNQPWLRPWVICTISAVIALLVLISAGIYQRNDRINMNYGVGQTYSVQVGSGTWAKTTQPAPIPQKVVSQSGPYSVLGKPTLTASFINQVLKAYNSPAAGKGQALYDLGVKYDIDPAFALAFFMHESKFGTQGEAATTLSLGNLRCYTGATCIDQDRGGYAKYATWEDGFQAWYELIHNYYIAQLGKVTIDQIIPTYAPTADNNDEQAYIASLKHEIDTWHAGQIYVQ